MIRGNIEKRGERHYRVRLQLGYDEAGKRLTRSVTVHGTRREAQQKLAELLKEAEACPLAVARPQSVAAYLDYWLEHYVGRLAPRTQENYKEYTEFYLKPGLGAMDLATLEPAHLQAFYRSLESRGRRGGGALSSTTLHHVHQVLRGALHQAVKWRMLATNPADAVVAPRIEERPVKTLTLEEVARLLEAARPTRHFLPILLGLSTGMRRGEIAGLRWTDLHLERRILAIQQTRVRVTAGTVITKTPKTRTGRRSIPLPAVLVEALQEEYQHQQAARAELGGEYNAENLVVCQADGTAFNPHSLYKGLQALLKKLDLPRISFHDLRHVHASHLLEAGVHPKVVSERLGHADPALTLRVYSHVLDTIQEAAAEETDALLRRALDRKEEPVSGEPG